MQYMFLKVFQREVGGNETLNCFLCVSNRVQNDYDCSRLATPTLHLSTESSRMKELVEVVL